MLKRIVFKNLVHFKEQTVIDFENYPKKQKRKAPVNTSEKNIGTSTGDDGKVAISCGNGKAGKESEAASKALPEDINDSNESNFNIFVGANFCGKSTVLELIRRCLTEDINLTATNSFDPTNNAYAFCEYELDSARVIVGFIKEPKSVTLQNDTPHNDICQDDVQQDAKLQHELPMGENPNDTKSQDVSQDVKSEDNIFKIFCHRTDMEVYLRWKIRKGTEERALMNSFKEEELLLSLFMKKELDADDRTIGQLLSRIKDQNGNSRLPEMLDWKDIEKKFVATFPLRGIGIVQWTKSDKIQDEGNYEKACERAEILSHFLSEKESEKIEKSKEKEIFDFITHPHVFTFTKENEEILVERIENKQIFVERTDKTTPNKFHLLKTSEGIIEAKIASLLLAHKDFKTICLEDPDRGMHPHMIERLKTVLYINGFDKTIIVVTHSPHFVDTITIRKTHVFFKKKGTSEPYGCSVTNAGKSDDLSYVDGIDTLRSLLFASKVLLVEGATDREVVQAIFTHIKYENLKKTCEEGISKTLAAFNRQDITIYQIIPIGSCQNVTRVQNFCNFINLPCLCLIDLDYFVKLNDNEKFTSKIDIGIREKLQLDEKYLKNELSTFLKKDFDQFSSEMEKKKIFVWKGDLEHAILSSKKLQDEIGKCLGINFNKLTEDQKARKLKEKLKSRLCFEERITFSSLLMKVKEITRFIAFLNNQNGNEQGGLPNKSTHSATLQSN